MSVMTSGSGLRRFDRSAWVLQKRLLPLGLAGLCTFVVLERLAHVPLADITASLGAVTASQWITAAIATALSFAAVGQYDYLFHRWLKTGVGPHRAVLSGAATIALAQTLGMGLATGTLARWRMLPEMNATTALKITNYVSFSFMAGLSLLSVVVLALPGTGNIGTSLWSLAAVTLIIAACVTSLIQPRWLPFPLPPLRMAFRLIGLVTLDVAFAALTLWILFPGALQPEFPVFLAAFTLALGAGLLSGTPGGVGPFELCLITLLPAVPQPELIAAILAFRLIYYALPACLALILLAYPKAPDTENLNPNLESPPKPISRAEALLSDQAGHRLLCTSDRTCLHVAEASQTLVAIGDCVTGATLSPAALQDLTDTASQASLWPALYKCTARSAAVARSQGWATTVISEEARIDTQTYTLKVPKRRQLRRKLKAAERAGVTVMQTNALPIYDMTAVANEWAQRVGGERGFSMGRFCPDHLARQRCYLAYAKGELVAFVSFHVISEEWTLDLMRSRTNSANGTIHALIHRAIEDAAAAGVTRLSLAAMPLESNTKLMAALGDRMSVQGLRRFKECFAPDVQKLYAAAPNRAILGLASVDILLRIITPKATRQAPALAPQTEGAC
jgi:phosphatidylglycerol lysyltransferase